MASKKTKAEDLRTRTPDELAEFVREKEGEILKLKFQKATGQLENVHRVREVKREIARARTIQTEKQTQKAASALKQA